MRLLFSVLPRRFCPEWERTHRNMKNKIAVVTGASTGYGVGIARMLVESGAKVWITGRNESKLQAVAKEIGATARVADVTSAGDWDALIEEVKKQDGRLDLLVNNAGAGIRIGPITEQGDNDIEQSISVNLTGAILGCRRAAEVMISQGDGLIINVGSVCANHAWGGWAVYSAAKAGLLQFSRCLLAELRPHGIRVTSVIPSWGQTEFTDSCGLGPRDPEVLEKCIAPDELGQLIVQIASQPPHLVTEEITLWPMVQPISQL